MTQQELGDGELGELLQFLYACPVGLASFADDGSIRRINPEAANLAASVLGVVSLDNMVEIVESHWPSFGELLATPTFGAAVRDHRIRVRRDCLEAWLSATVVRLGPDQWMMVLANVTTLVAGEQALQNGERQMRTVFDAIDEGFCICEMIVDDDGSPIDYRLLQVNPLFVEMTGLHDAVGRTALELEPALDHAWIETFARVGLGRETVRFEQGSDVTGWFDVFAVPLDSPGQFAAVFKDETKRKSADSALRAAAREATFRSRLGDALRLVDDAVAIEEAATRALGEHVGAFRVQYVEIGAEDQLSHVRTEYRTKGAGTTTPHHPADFGPRVMEDLRALRTVLVRDVDSDPRFDDNQRDAQRSSGVAAFVVVPIARQDQVRSALAVHWATADGARSVDLAVIEETAERMASALDRAQTTETLRVRHLRSEAVAALLVVLEGTPTLKAQGAAVADAMVDILGDYATVEHPGGETPLIAAAHQRPEMLAVLQTVRTLRIASEAADPMARVAQAGGRLLSPIRPAELSEWATTAHVGSLLDQLGPRSQMSVPLRLGGDAAGALVVGITNPQRGLFSPEDLVFLQETAIRIGIVLSATALRRQEHQVAIRLQKALLPDVVLWHPNVVIEACYAAATADLEVGGDWYDTYAWDDGRIGLMVGDVVGHNLESAATMGRLRSAAAALAPRTAGSPAALLDDLEQFALGHNGTKFATAACMVIDPFTGTATYASAGHPPPIVLSPDGSCAELRGAVSPPLCFRTGGQRVDTSFVLAPNSVVVMYSDGLVERRTQTLDQGMSSLQRALVARGGQSAARIADELLEISARVPFEDDVVVVCFRYTPPIARFERLVAAEAHDVAAVRRELQAWLARRGVKEESSFDILLTMSEAASNAALHAYRDGGGGVHIDVADHGHHVSLRVHDRGRWRFKSTAQATGGRGVGIMTTVAHRMERRSTADGTTVTMVLQTPGRYNDQ